MSDFFRQLSEYMTSPIVWQITETLGIILVLSLLKWLVSSMIGRRCEDLSRCYYLRRRLTYIYAFILVLFCSYVWIPSFSSIATFLGLTSAGLAVAMHDALANLAGWVFIVTRAPFKVGDRIQIGDTAGDVIDIRLFQFSVIELGNWVRADQSTGRIVHLPNSLVWRQPLANYETGFEYIWHEIPVVVTFESNWEKAKKILLDIVNDNTEHLSEDAKAQIRRAAMKYLIYFRYLTPIVYTTVLDNGISLTIRYIIKPRQRRASEEKIWEEILRQFAKHDDISLAYPTTRFYLEPGDLKAGIESARK